ncbi:MAG: phosphatidylinositol-specific phospholipase C/glycerophosphodiester phosphodiesterase family protein [Candidatus Sumerlaeota bacterium]|nr:phosphatidylinositol-specific phospholipase C/glycerophosphodiester phosphodiesterase family protein [Candidatus Sumerlaeota bacterium]
MKPHSWTPASFSVFLLHGGLIPQSMRTLLALFCLSGAAALAQQPAPAQPLARITPLTNAHSHNDYEHARPLLDALDCGFCSIEPDVWLVDGQLLVAHELKAVRKDRTLQSLYLDPLRERVEKNGGRVYPNGPAITLLIDFKSSATETYQAFLVAIKPYEKMLTAFYPDRKEERAVTIIISGNRPLQFPESESVRYAAVDGRLTDLNSAASPLFMPLISENWAKVFKWKAQGPIPAAEKAKLRDLVAKAHEKGKRIRFWNIPNSPDAWRELQDAGVDLINADNLTGLRDFLLANTAQKTGTQPK